MLFIINAAEAQFRHESVSRAREHALLTSIRERRAVETAVAGAPDIGARRHARPAAEPIRNAARSTRFTWTHTRGVENCAVACATG